MTVKFDKARRRQKREDIKEKLIIKVGGYRCNILLAPLIPIVWAVEKYTNYKYKKCVWSEEKATKVLDKILPQVLEYVAEENAYYYCCEWHCSTLLDKSSNREKMWVNKFINELVDYLALKYENENYIKTIEDDKYEKWIKFAERG